MRKQQLQNGQQDTGEVAARSRERSPEPDGDVHLAVVVPTRNEVDNVAPLLRRLEEVFHDGLDGVEVIFVDDSTDETPAAVAAESERSPLTVRLIHRPPEERDGGLGGAVLAGFRASDATWFCVIDGDLQHPPELIREMAAKVADTDADIVVASRYTASGTNGGLSRSRAIASSGLTGVTRLVFPRRLRRIHDPLSGFFLVRRGAIALKELRPRGFKILLEIVARSPLMRAAEVPFEFGTRHAGESKASTREAITFLTQLARLRLGGRPRLLTEFAAVGLTGLAVNMGLFAALLAWNVHYVLAALLATQGSTIWLFALTDRWVFRGRSFTRGLAKRVGLYFALNNAGFVARGLLLVALVSGLGLGALVANLITLVALTLVRFFVADSWIWHRRADTGPIAYDVHGIVTAQSEVALPELARFRVASLDGAPDVDVKLGQLHDTGKDLADDLVFATRHIHYDDGLGRLGFAVQIRKGRTTEIAASRLVGASPHVLYTNVVEPVLRWRIVASGYALVHAACVAFDGRAVFVTARTDTGKTTTILKALDNYPCEFISDDLTLLTPDGRVLTYPKPLTVSKHTVGAVKTPNLTFKQRLGLPLQSRIHSKSGRAFAFLLEKLHLPVATINALLQVIVPPPKYHVDKLVPTVTCVTDAQLAGVVVIERADNDEELALSGLEATDLLISNTEDAYGFPPYPTIAHSLHGEGSDDLRVNEREIIAAAVGELPASILRRRERDWWQHLPTMVAELRVVADDDTDEGGPEPPSQEPPFSDPLPQLPDLEPGAESEPIEIDASTARATTAQPPRPPAIVGSVEHMADAPTSLATSSAPALEHRNGSRSVTQAVSRVGDELSRLAQLASARRAAIASSTGSLTQLPSYEMFRPRTRLASFTISRSVAVAIALGTVLAIGSFVRLWALNRYGFNSDEAVYGGQGASIAGHAELSEFFPTFRAHPLLYQSVLSLGFYLGGFDLFARFVSVGIGLVTVYLTYRVGTLSYNRRVGLIAAALMALMPYHVLVSRQVLLDAPMAMFATLALYLLVRYSLNQRPLWLYATAGAVGLTFLSKEAGILFVGSIYVFFALSPQVKVRLRHLVGSSVVMGLMIVSYPLSVALAGNTDTGGNYLAWQLFRRPNHSLLFYPAEVPRAVGYLVLLAAAVGLFVLWKRRSWRETLLLSWIIVPAIFFELYPVKGFHYLVSLAPALAVLAARPLALLLEPERRRVPWRLALGVGVTGIVLVSLAVPSWQRIQPSTSDTFLAGSGGVPGGREAGRWISANVPEGARFLTIGPSMANIIQYYGNRKAFGLSVSPNPLRRNPSYQPIDNPDLRIRTSELQYLVWDSYSAGRSEFFSERLLRYADRYNGRGVHTQSVAVTADSGEETLRPLIVIYEVRPVIAQPPGDEDD